RRAEAQVELAQARAVLAEREAAYERIVGHAPPPEMSAQELDDIASFTSVEEAQNAALNNNPAINAAREAVKAVEHAKDAAKGEFAPRLSVEGNYFRRFGDAAVIANREEEYQVVARMRMPIFQQGQNIASLRTAGATVTEERSRMAQTELIIREAVARSWRQFLEVTARRIAAKSGIEAAELSVKGLQIEYEAGQRTVIDVLDGQRDLVNAMIDYSQAEHDYYVSQFDLAAATGIILAYSGETAQTPSP
ncbi:MAG: TolC family protein, partial [Hyphococcus sp.]